MIDIKVKRVNTSTKKNDTFLCRDPLLCGVIKLKLEHNHTVEIAEALRLPRRSTQTRAFSHSYFAEGMSPAEAIGLDKGNLAARGDAASIEQLANGPVNPIKRTHYHLCKARQRDNHGPILDPLTELQEKLSAPVLTPSEMCRQTTNKANCRFAFGANICSGP